MIRRPHHKIATFSLWLSLFTSQFVRADPEALINGVVDLPKDAHLSAGTLPVELLTEAECTCGSSSARSVDKNQEEAKIFYLVGIHNNRTLDDALFLFRGIRDARNTILIHIDTKFDFQNYETSVLRREVEACPCGSHVEVASVHNAKWSSWSMNLPTLWGMEKAVNEYRGKWDVFINLSGDSLPVYKPDRIAQLFGGPLKGINFITSSACETGLTPTPITAFPKTWHKRSHYSNHPALLDYTDDDGTKHYNVSLTTYFGSQWMALLPDWCEFLVSELKRPESLPSKFRDHLIATKKLMTDETFIPTLIMYLRPETSPRVNSDYSLVIPDKEGVIDPLKIYAIRYERMDEHVPSSTGWFPSEQRYEVPDSSGVEKPKAWGPYYLGVYDLANIRQSGALFIRKVATAVDPNIFLLLPVDGPRNIPPIAWPKEVKLSPVPNWEKKLVAMKEKFLQEKELKSAEVTQTSQDDEVDPQNEDGDNDDAEITEQEEDGNASDDDMGSNLPQELRPKFDGEGQQL